MIVYNELLNGDRGSMMQLSELVHLKTRKQSGKGMVSLSEGSISRGWT